MNMIILTDLEGAAGVFSFADQAFPDGKYYQAAKGLLTAQVNAAVEAAVQSGIGDILVVDGHGCGGIEYESLHPAARLMHGMAPWTRADMCAPVMRRYQLAALVGQHAMEGTVDGNLNHSQSSRNIAEIRLNDQPIGELAQWALFCGAFDIPLVFVSGDHSACREAEMFVPGITTAAVKEGMSREGAISLSLDKACELIGGQMEKAIKQQSARPVAPLKWPAPYRIAYRMKHTHPADEKSLSGWERVDAYTVAKSSPNLLDVLYA